MSRRLIFIIFAIFLSFILVSCTGLTGQSNETSNVSVLLTDAPITGLDEFNADINAVTVNYETPEGTNTKTNLVDLKNFNLLTLAATETELFNFSINPDATIDSIKVNIGNPATAVINGTNYTVSINGVGSSDSKDVNIAGVSINVGPDGKDLIIDFDVAESIIYTGSNNYKMAPVLKLRYRDRNQERNYFYGTISPNSQWFLRLTYNDSAVATTMTNSNGEFRFGGVNDGTYILNVYDPSNIDYKDSEDDVINLPSTPTATDTVIVPDDNGNEFIIN